MVQCEMCGADTQSPTTVKIEGAELDVCSECTEFGTEVRQQSSSSTSTKYSTASDSGAASGSASSSAGGSSTGGSTSRRRDMFDEMDELVADYDQRIREARESRSLSQEELAKQLNEKASLIRKLERGDMLPSDEVQTKLERSLEISLVESGSGEETEWEGGSSTGSYTLGDVVTRKD